MFTLLYKSLLNTLFSALLFICFFFLVGLSPQKTLAQTIGSHLGEGDYNWQIDIMNHIAGRISQGDNTEAFPVTIQVRIPRDTRGINDFRSNMQKLSSAVNAHGFFAIVRIDGSCEQLDVDTITQTVQVIRESFGANAPIMFGNEINNEKECATPEQYWSNYQTALAANGSGPFGPAALDFYHPNKPSNFLPTIIPNTSQENALANYIGTVKLGNAYGCIGANADNCDILMTTTHEQGYKDLAGSGPLFLPEFSLSPGDGEPNNNAPDTNLRKVVEFIEQRATETGATAITPLIRNVCNSDGDWLIYISSQFTGGDPLVITRSNTPVNIATCSGTTQDDYFLYPIAGINNPNLSVEDRKETIKNDLAAQGYEAQCLSPLIKVDALVNALQPVELYTSVGIETVLQTDVTQDIDLTNARVPAWRQDGTNDISILNSLETLFGFRDPTETIGETNLINSVNSAPLYRRTSLVQQCELQISILNTIENMCNTLADPDSCALDQEISVSGKASNYTIKTLREELKRKFGTSSDGSISPQICGSVVSETDLNEPIRKALSNVPLYLGNAYRLGFLVVTAQLTGDEISVTNDRPFRFLRSVIGIDGSETTSREPTHEVRVFAFRLPDIGMNRNPESDIYYQDPLEITRNTILSKRQQEQVAKKYNEMRAHINEPVPTHINCTEPPNSPYCNNNPVVQSLVEYVNEKLIEPINNCDLDPEAFNYQKVSSIFSSASLAVDEPDPNQENADSITPGSGQTYKDPESGNIIDTLRDEYSITQSTNPQNGGLPFRFLSEARARDENTASPPQSGAAKTMEIRSFMIIPQGFQLAVTEQALAGRFMTHIEMQKFYESFGLNPTSRHFISDNQTELAALTLQDKTIRGRLQSSFGNLAQFFMLDNVSLDLESSPRNRVSVWDCSNVLTEEDIAEIEENGHIVENSNGLADDFLPNDGTSQGTRTADIRRGCVEKFIENRSQSNQANHAPRIRGGILGETLIRMQRSLQTMQSDTWQHLNSCESIEDFLLNQC